MSFKLLQFVFFCFIEKHAGLACIAGVAVGIFICFISSIQYKTPRLFTDLIQILHKLLLLTFFSLLFRPAFRLFLSYLYYFYCHFILGYWDSADIFIYSFDESRAPSNSLSPQENVHQVEEEENLPIPNQNNIPVPPLDPVDQYRLLYLDTELELFARIRNLENRLIEGLPPQLNHFEYETLVRGFLAETLTVPHYFTILTNELLDLTVLELEADLVEQLFDLFMGETPDRLSHILGESPFPEHAIRAEALEFIVNSLDHLNLGDPRSNFDRILLDGTLRNWVQDVQQHRHQSAFYGLFLDHFQGSI